MFILPAFRLLVEDGFLSSLSLAAANFFVDSGFSNKGLLIVEYAGQVAIKLSMAMLNLQPCVFHTSSCKKNSSYLS